MKIKTIKTITTMKKMKRVAVYSLFHLFTLSLFFSLLSCSDFLKEEDKDKMIPETVEQFRAMLHKEAFLNVSWFYRSDMMTDCITENPDATTDNKNGYWSLYTWQKDVEVDGSGHRTEATNNMWGKLYEDILVANYVIEQGVDVIPENLYLYGSDKIEVQTEPGDMSRVSTLFDAQYGDADKERFVFTHKQSVGDFPGCWTTYPISGDGKSTWSVDSDASEGCTALKTPELKYLERSYISVSVKDVESLSWRWKVSNEDVYFSCYVDNELRMLKQGIRDNPLEWDQVSVELGEGVHVVKIECEGWGWVTAGCGWVDGLVIKRESNIQYQNKAFIQMAEGNQWILDGETYRESWVSYRSPAIDYGQTAEMRFEVSGQTEVSWWWKVSRESWWNYLRCFVDGVEHAKTYDAVNWQKVSVALDGGRHEIKITYSKDDSGSRKDDCAWVDGLAIRCTDWRWQGNEEGGLVLSGFDVLQSDVKIPCAIGDYSVTELSDWLFESCDDLKSVVVSNGIKRVGAGAFADCRQLEHVSLPESVINIGGSAFRNTPLLARSADGPVVIDGCVIGFSGSVGSLLELPTGARLIAEESFKGCSSISTVYLPQSIAVIGKDAFANCTSIRTIYVDAGDANRMKTLLAGSGFSVSGRRVLEVGENVEWYYVEQDGLLTINGVDPAFGALTMPSEIDGRKVASIGASAFYGCKDIAALSIPKTVAQIGSDAFLGCSRLTKMEVDKDNPSYGMFGEMLMTKDGRSVLFVTAAATEITMPKTVEEIEYNAFASAVHLSRIRVPAGSSDRIKGIVENSGFSSATLEFQEYVDVAFNANGGTCETVLRQFVLDDVYSDLPFPVRKDYMFMGWFTGATGGVQVGGTMKIDTSVKTLYAHWEKIEWSYELQDDDTILLTGCSPAAYGNLIIPSEIDGKAVTAIGDGAFAQNEWSAQSNDNIVDIVLPDTLTSIGANAFAYCRSMKSINIPACLHLIGKDAFGGCDSVEFVRCRDLAAWCAIAFGNDNANPLHCGADLMVDGEKLEQLVSPPNLEEISNFVFCGCRSLRSATVQEGVLRIGDGAFLNCSVLDEVVLPSSVEHFGESVFEGTAYWKSMPLGMIVRGQVLMGCVGSVEADFVVPDGIVEIAGGAFSGNPIIKSVSFPDSLKVIGKNAFRECGNLSSVAFPAGLNVVDDGAFYNCSLKSVWFPSSIHRIGKEAFLGMNLEKQRWAMHYRYGDMSEVVIEDAENLVIDDRAFYYQDLDKIWISGKNITIGDSAFMQNSDVSEVGGYNWTSGASYDVRLRGENIRVGDYAFADMQHRQGYEGILDLTGVSSIGKCAFRKYGLYYWYDDDHWRSMYGDADVRVSSQLEDMAESAFHDAYVGVVRCERLSDVFDGCKMLKFSSSSDLGGGYWYSLYVGEEKVTNVTVAASVSELPEGAFCNVQLKSFVLPEGIKRIGAYAFEDCHATIIEVPDGVEEVGPYAFKNNSMTSFLWPSRAPEMPSYAFYGCASLTTLMIPKCVNKIDSFSFRGCDGLKTVMVEPDEKERVCELLQTAGLNVAALEFVVVRFLDVSFDVGAHGKVVGGGKLTQRVLQGMAAEMPEIAADEGWSFVGWDRDVSNIQDSGTITAVYEPIKYQITYEGCENVENPNPSSYTIDESLTFERLPDGPNVRFVGWKPMKIEKGSTGDKTIVACWEAKTVSDLLKGCGDVTLSGDANWFAQWADSEWVLKSGDIVDRQKSTLSCFVNGGGVLVFKWKVSSECVEGWHDDYLNVEVDGQEVAWIGGEKGWLEQRIELAASDKPHEVKWSYNKDKSDSAGEDCGWLKEVVWTPDAVAPTLDDLAEVFGEDSDVVKNIKDETKLAAFNAFLKNCLITSADGLTEGQKQYAYQSFKLAEITTEPQLFEEKPVLKIDDIELSGGNLSVTISLTAGTEAIQLAKDKLAEKVRVGTSLNSIIDKPDIDTSMSKDGTSVTFTFAPPQSNQGFVKVLLD